MYTGFRVQGLGFRVQGLGLRVEGGVFFHMMCRVWGQYAQSLIIKVHTDYGFLKSGILLGFPFRENCRILGIHIRVPLFMDSSKRTDGRQKVQT